MKKNKSTQIVKTLIFLSYLCFANTYAQNIEQNKTSIAKDYNQEQLALLNGLLDRQDYATFYEKFKSINVQSSSQIKYLDDLKHVGHTPLYWLMADYYAKNKNPFQTHKWLYIATIMTQQDSYLCVDGSSKFATQKLLRSFPSTTDITLKTPTEISRAMPEVIFFIENLKTRTNPSWACMFGEYPVTNKDRILTSKSNWASTRAKVFSTFTKNYKK